MKAVFFAAGLGDFIRSCYESNRYVLLAEATEMMGVVLAMHNPYVVECFLHHPNGHRLQVVSLPGHFDYLRNAGLRGPDLHHALMRRAGFEPEQFVFEKRPCSPVFYAMDDLQTEGHILIQPFAGTPERSIPLWILKEVLALCADTGRLVHIVTRGSSRVVNGKLFDGQEELPSSLVKHERIMWHQGLSVPATINLVKSCSMFIGSHSAMLLAAWFERKPVHALYPKNFIDWTPERIGRGYTFGANYDTTVHQPFEEFSTRCLLRQLELLGLKACQSSLEAISTSARPNFLRRRRK